MKNKKSINELEILYPFDNAMLHRTRDYMFIYYLSSRWKEEGKYFSVFTDNKSDKKKILIEDINKRYFHPITHEEIEILENWKLKYKIARKKVLKGFVYNRYNIRSLLRNEIKNDNNNKKKNNKNNNECLVKDSNEISMEVFYNLKIDGITIHDNNKFLEENFIEFNKKPLKWPIQKENDPILDDFNSFSNRIENNFLLSRTLEAKNHDICPIDGIVTPIYYDSYSNDRVRFPDGNVYQHTIPHSPQKMCPKCLFSL